MTIETKFAVLGLSLSENLAGVITFAIAGGALAGFCMVTYCLYAISIGRQKARPAYPFKQAVLAGILGSLLISFGVLAGFFAPTVV